jgi:hypothetical protein
MKKSLIIKLAVAVVIVLLSYCVFWLFKIGQSERKITSIVQKSKIISFDKISSAGFPFSQKISVENLKINIPVNAIVKRNFIAKKLEISSSIFSNNFKVKIVDEVEVKTIENNSSYLLQFNTDPEISFSIINNAINNFTYSDSGFKIVDAKNNKTIHTAASMNISLPSPFVFEQEDQNPVAISLNIKQLTGYSFLNFYKNVFEDKVIEGIKTGEIKINQGNQNNNNSFILDPAVLSNLATTNPALFQQIQQLTMQIQVNPASAPEINNQIQQLLMQASINAQANQVPVEVSNSASPNQPNNNINTQSIQVPLKANAEQPVAVNVAENPSSPNLANTQAPAVPTAPAPAPASPQVANVEQPVPNTAQVNNNIQDSNSAPQPIATAENMPNVAQVNSQANTQANTQANDQNINQDKIDIALEIEISSTPIEKEKAAAEVPVDPSLMEENSQQYAENVLIKSISFSHEKYKILINGKLISLLDDINLSGGITVKIENYYDFVNLFKTELQNYIQQSTMKENSDALIFEKYQAFLRNLDNSLSNLTNEIASKNPATKDKNAQLDIRREKNLDFIINETPIYEILGKI